jgi:hypothetical protein
VSELPQDIKFDPANPPEALPPLPDGFTWGLKVTAEAEVIPASQNKES